MKISELERSIEAAAAATQESVNRKTLETRSISDDERMAQLEEQVKEAKYIAEDAERKYDEAARRLAVTEVDLERAEARLETSERCAKTLEDQLSTIAAKLKAKEIARDKEELRIVGNNMKSLEVSEQEVTVEPVAGAVELEEMYLKRLNVLRDQVREAECRAEDAEAVSKRYEQEVQRVKDTLFSENKTFTLLRKEIDSALDEYHSI
ncbi:unnamed protein product [Hydatigera taeniaeformis]|uniref:Tropomyosin n=1 Tax=Hydatigena taeniaeformis TaxID=6205 RepID=A0A0R3WRL7_HYDTA|nr:unnamed protein product [Hydatigera taeniaeformis]